MTETMTTNEPEGEPKTWYLYSAYSGRYNGDTETQANKPEPIYHQGEIFFDWTDVPLTLVPLEVPEGIHATRTISFNAETQSWSQRYNVFQDFQTAPVYVLNRQGVYRVVHGYNGYIDEIPDSVAQQFVPFPAQVDESTRTELCNLLNGYKNFVRLDAGLHLETDSHTANMLALRRLYGDGTTASSEWKGEHTEEVLSGHNLGKAVKVKLTDSNAATIVHEIMQEWGTIRDNLGDINHIMHEGNGLVERLQDKTGVQVHLEFNRVYEAFSNLLPSDRHRRILRAILLFNQSKFPNNQLVELRTITSSDKREVDGIIQTISPAMMSEPPKKVGE